jgi:hypothetical protein
VGIKWEEMKTSKKSLSAKPKKMPVKLSVFDKFVKSVKNIRPGKNMVKVIGSIGSAGLAVLAVKFVPWKSVGSAIHNGLIRIEESFNALQARQTVE